MSGIIKMVHRSDDPAGPFKTIAEVAEYFERSKDTIRRWGEVIGVPTHKMPTGDDEEWGDDPDRPFVWVYTENDIAALEDFSSGINPKGGRPPKEDGEKHGASHSG